MKDVFVIRIDSAIPDVHGWYVGCLMTLKYGRWFGKRECSVREHNGVELMKGSLYMGVALDDGGYEVQTVHKLHDEPQPDLEVEAK